MKFELDAYALSQLAKFKENHRCPVNNTGAIGVGLTFKFIETSIGTLTSVKCVCGLEQDLTDVDKL